MADDHWEDIDPSVPVLLLPVRVETRSDEDGAVLRVRIYPDDIHLDAFDERLTEDEVNAGKRYWHTRWPLIAGDAPDPWAQLTAAVGPHRAAWVASALTPTNLGDRSNAAPQFPAVPVDVPEHRVWARLLPDCFRVVAVQGGERGFATGEAIDPDGVALGPRADVASDELRVAIDMLRGQPGVDADPALAWLTDYGLAEAAGMAVTVALPRPKERVDRLYVFGVRAAESPADGATGVANLLRAHAFSDGLGFPSIGTATNNTAAARAAWSHALGAPGQPALDPSNAPSADSNAGVLAAALGVDPGVLAGLEGADATDQRSAGAFATALWPVTWSVFLDKTLVPTAAGGALPVVVREAIRAHAISHVRGRGPLPPLRVGRQPYGVLPVSTYGPAWQPIEDGPVDRGLARFLNRIRPLWRSAAARVPTVTSGDIERDVPAILGRLPVSRGLRVRTALTGEEATDVVAPALGAISNTSAQRFLAAALESMLGIDAGLWVAPDILGEPARILALPLTDETDTQFCETLLALREVPDPASVLQALLALAEARARHDVERYLAEERLRRLNEWLSSAEDWLDSETIALASDGLQRMADRVWDELDLYREAAGRIDAYVAPFDPTRYAARFPMAMRRPHPVDSARTLIAGVRVAAAALRAAQRFAELRRAIRVIGGIADPGERSLFLAETLDCASHRLDAWLTSLATRRLAVARDNGAEGLAVGAFGWLENIEIDPPATVDALPDVDEPVYQDRHDGGYVLAPTPAHAATAAVLRGARLTHDPQDSGDAALDIDLSSTRVRAALSVIDGMRSGQSLGALLGYRLERWLHDAPRDLHLDRFIYCLRSAAPLTAAKSTDRAQGVAPEALESVAAGQVVDGVRLLALHRANPAAVMARLDNPPQGYLRYFDEVGWSAPTPDQRAAVAAVIDRLDRLHDAVADVLLAESVHQLVIGSPARAAAAMDALAGDAIPPDPEVVHSPRSGVALTHRLMVLLPAGPPDAGSGWSTGARGAVHPGIEGWARDMLGDATDIVLASDSDGDATATLADAEICALDLIAAATGSADTAEPRRFWALLQRRIPALADVALPGQTFAEAWAMAGSLRRLLAGTRAATAADLIRASDASGDGAPGAHRGIDRADLRSRAGAAIAALGAAVQQPGSPIERADALAFFGFGVSVDPAQLPPTELEAHVAALVAAAEARLAGAAAALDAYDVTPPVSDSARLTALGDAVGQVFDDRQPFTPRLLALGPADPFVAALRAGVRVGAENRAVTDGRDVRPWLTRYARVRPAVGRFAETLLLAEALGPRRTLRVAQLSDGDFGTWIGLTFPPGAGPPANPITGYVVDTPAPPQPADPLVALIVDDWSEVVPRRTEVRDPVTGEPTGSTREVTTAGLAVNANGPNARAPQSLLLAVSPDGQPWSPDKVTRLLADVLATARERAVTLEDVPLVGRLLPATYVQDWSLQGEPVLDMFKLVDRSAVRDAVLTHISEKD